MFSSHQRTLSGLRITLVSLITLISLVANVPAQRVWVERGPGPITDGQVEGIPLKPVAGAIKTVATHPTDVNTIYIGAVNGGIWKTTEATAATPAWTWQLGLNRSLSIGAIEFDPLDGSNQTLVAGNGRFNSLSKLIGGDRAGVWRTTDGGENWTLVSGTADTVAGLNVTGVAARGATLVVAADTANNDVNSGIWQSTNTGSSWTKISGAGTGLPTGASFDLAGDPSNPSILFTNAGRSGIFRSPDVGATWTKVSNAAIDELMAAGTVNVKISVGRSNNVYVAIVNMSGQLAGLFRSPNGINTWTPLDLPTTTEDVVDVGVHAANQGDRHFSITADLINENVVYIGGDRQPARTEFTTGVCPCFPNSIVASDFSGRLFRVDASLPRGTQSTHITNSNTLSGTSPHADSRDMAMDAAGNLIETDDGGIYKRSLPLLNTGDWSALVGNLRITEFHSVAWDSNLNIAIGGAQDTGSPHGTVPESFVWQSVSTADGGDLAINDTGSPEISVRFSSNPQLRLFRRRTYDRTVGFISEVFPDLRVVDGGALLRPQFISPIALNNVSPTRLVIGGLNSVYESLDEGWTISEVGPGIIAGRHSIAYGATGNADMLYVGAGDRMYVRTAAALSPLIQSTTYPGTGTNRRVEGVTINHSNPQNAFVIDASNVYRTGDAGVSWTNITGNLLTLNPGALSSVAMSTSNPDGSVIVGSDKGVFISPGPLFTTWIPLGTGLPRAPVFDLEYDPTDQILIAGLMGRGAWTINMGRTPIDVAMVLDLSASMRSPACATCDPKIDVLKEAVEIFLQLWTLFTTPDDRISTTYFRTNVSEFVSGADVLVPPANATAMIGDVRSQSASNLTALGGGIQTAINRLTDPSRTRNLIVFTDGMQNVNPMVNPTTFEIANEPGKSSSGVAPTTPLTTLNTASGIKVNTIGVGATPPFVDLLNNIASATNGRFKLTSDPDDLRRFFVEELIDVLHQFSPQLVGYRYGKTSGGTASESFTANRTAQRVVLKLSGKRGTRLDFRVEKDGVDVTKLGRFVDGPFYRIFAIDVPTRSGPAINAAGSWTMRITGPDQTAYEAAAIVDEKNLKFEFNTGSSHRAGDPLTLAVKVAFDGRPVTDAHVTARVFAPREALSNLLSQRATPSPAKNFQYETGATEAQRKFQLLLDNASIRDALLPVQLPVVLKNNADGTYSTTFTNTSISGPYTILYRVEGSRTDIGNYTRTESQTVALSFGTPATSSFNLRLLDDKNPAGKYSLVVRPVDVLGNFLGPDYGHGIVVTVNGVGIKDPPQDRLDGSYVFPLLVTTPAASTNVSVTVLGRTMFNGPLSKIPTLDQISNKFAVSVYSGVAIPVVGFGSNGRAGLLTEFDFEYRARSNFSLEGVAGRYDFGNAEIHSGSLLAKGYFPVRTGRFYASGGPGVFHPSGGNLHFGLNGSAGFNMPINSWFDLDFGASYSHVFRTNASDLGFVGLRGGVKFKF